MSTTITTNEDTYADPHNTTTNYGSSNIIRLFSGYLGFTSFDISSLGRVDNAKWYVYISAGSTNYSIGCKLRRCLVNSIDESTLTYANKPSTTTTGERTWGASPTSVGTWVYVTITDLLNAAIEDGYDNLVLESSVYVGGASYEYNSKEYSGGANAPYILIDEATDLYVKADGDDTKSGLSWTNAWRTVNKAMVEAVDGQTIHIGFDSGGNSYNTEPLNNTLSPDITGTGDNVIVIFETAGGSGGSGTATIEVNPTS